MSPKRHCEEEHPEEKGYFGYRFDIFLTWVNPLIQLANVRNLEESDVWNCPKKYDVDSQTKILWEAWYQEVDLAHQEDRRPSLIRAMWHGYKDKFLYAGMYQFGFMLFQLGQPFLVGQLVKYLKTGEGGIERGLALAFGFCGVSLCSSMCIAVTLDLLRRLGVSIRSACMMMVYEQALKLTTSARMNNSVGQTTNLMAIDAEKLNIAVQFVHFLWHGPLVGLIIMIILIFEIGYAPALAGMAFLFVLFPCQNYFASDIGKIRRQMIKFTDERVKLINESLQAIRVIKLYAWEKPIENRVNAVRENETKFLRKYLDASARLRELMFSAQPVAALVIVTVAAYGIHRPLNIVQIFRVLAFLNITRLPLNLLGQALKNCSDGLVSISRLNAFLLQRTLPINKERKQVENPTISLSHATFSWQDQAITVSTKSQSDKPHPESSAITTKETSISDYFRLQNISFVNGKRNELIAVIGPVGSGKSSFISSILGEMVKVEGQCQVAGTISYCSQTPWIQNLTLQQNVLFEIPDKDISQDQLKQYYEATEAAALRPDIKILPAGDKTEIGERGINLSGGQKARVSLARAFFAKYRSQIYLLDDPFSAVDGNTGNTIFQKVLEDGCVVADGSFDSLFQANPELMSRITGLSYSSRESPVIEDSIIADLKEESTNAPVIENPTEIQKNEEETLTDNTEDDTVAATTTAEQETTGTNTDGPIAGKSRMAPMDIEQGPSSSLNNSSQTIATDKANSSSNKDSTKKLVQQEKIDSGISTMVAYLKYFSASLVSVNSIQKHPFYSGEKTTNFYSTRLLIFGFLSGILLLILFSSTQFFRLAVDYCIVKFSANFGHYGNYWQRMYYSSFGLLLFFLLLRSVYLNFFAVRSSSVLHASVLRRVLSAPITTFFDTHTVGAILNRFSKDMETVEVNIPEFMLQLLINWFQVFSVFGLCIWASPWFVLVLVPLGFGFFKVYSYFSCSSRDLKRLESVSRSPIYASLSETLTGLETIRAYGDNERFLQTHMKRMQRNQNFMYHLYLCTSWMTIRLEVSTSIILTAVSLLSVCLRESVSPISLGLALSYGLQLTALFQRCVQLVIEIQTYMTSTERVLEYLEKPQEVNYYPEKEYSLQKIQTQRQQDTPISGKSESSSSAVGMYWPKSGEIELRNVWMQYRDNPPVLKGLTAHIKSGERIGVCGRTGAGKSSVMMALFRIVELSQGEILLDGVDISSVPLTQLRSNLAIIPQDPVLFTGTIRFQLDPFEQYPDLRIWEVLDQVNMGDMVKSLPNGLKELVSEGGDNLSQGQRQLLCIARALLRDAKVLVVDEGTSAVDPFTDDLIQQVLRKQAKEKGITVLAIAHRLQTIVDFDRILVLGQGTSLEFDSPSNLLADPNSVFSSMMKESHH